MKIKLTLLVNFILTLTNGFELCTKTVTDKSKYQWPNNENEAMLITKKQFSWLLDGLSIHQSKAFHEMKQRIF